MKHKKNSEHIQNLHDLLHLVTIFRPCLALECKPIASMITTPLFIGGGDLSLSVPVGRFATRVLGRQREADRRISRSGHSR